MYELYQSIIHSYLKTLEGEEKMKERENRLQGQQLRVCEIFLYTVGIYVIVVGLIKKLNRIKLGGRTKQRTVGGKGGGRGLTSQMQREQERNMSC